MTKPAGERRQFPRRGARHEFAVMPASMNVRILDISISGVLIESRAPVDPGARGRLRLNLDGLPVTVEVLIQRVAEASGPDPRFRVGASFVRLDIEQQQLIERFVRQ